MFLKLSALFLLFVSSYAGNDKPEWYIGDTILSSPELTHWGDWKEWEYCPEKKFVIGMSLKTESKRGIFKDDTALNGIKLHCDQVGFLSNNVSVTSGVNERGDYDQDFFCKGVATGFQLRSEKNQSPLADDTAANNLRLFCNANGEFIEGDGLSFGEWTGPRQCFSKQAICGIQTQVEMEHGNGDETAVNNIKIKCCDVPDPASECIPLDQWETLIECDNMEAETPTTCSYERKVGISNSKSSSESHWDQTEIYNEIGFSLKGAVSGLNLNFYTNLAISHKTGHNWTVTNSEVWSVETKTTVSFDTPPGVKTELFQTVGHCGLYDVKATRVKRVDTRAGVGASEISYFDF